MSNRSNDLETFLFLAGWSDGERYMLAGDASNRRYDRLTHPGMGRAVLMDAPPDKGEDIRPFIKIAHHLRAQGLSAPEILSRDTEHGFLILEDLGDALFARLLFEDNTPEEQLYEAAVEALFVAQFAKPPEGIGHYGPQEMAEAACLAPDWYLAHATDNPPDIRAEFRGQLRALLDTYLTAAPVLTQRDYHAENLIWLPKREGVARVGLLDFQDAMLGDPAYDLASLLKDARRHVSPGVQKRCIAQFRGLTGIPREAFDVAYALCSAQRNLRIMGVFTRLCVRDHKGHYPEMLQRVWRNLRDDLTHPALEEFGTFVMTHFPAPTDDIITRIQNTHV